MTPILAQRSIEESQELSTSLLLTCLLVSQDSVGSGQHDVTKSTGRKDVQDPLLNVLDTDVESGGDNSAFIDSTNEVNYNLSRSMVVDDLELADVSVLLHGLEKLDNDLGGRSDDDLSLASLLGVRHGLQAVRKH